MAILRAVEPPPANQSVVSLLEHCLDRAKEGEFSSMLIVFMDRDGFAGSKYSSLPSVSAIVGAMERAKWDLIRDANSE